MKRFLKKIFNLTNLFGTITVFAVMGILGSIGVQFDFLNVFEQVLSDYELTDIYYTKFRQNDQVPSDTNIVLVNIGKLSREEIAREIEILNKYNPAVIGIDAFFSYPKPDNPHGDTALAMAVKNAKNFVMVSKVEGYNEETGLWDTLIKSYSLISDFAHTGFANTISDEEGGNFVTWRNVPVKEKLKNGHEEVCFAAKIMEFYRPEKAKKFLARGNEVETIYFKGNLDKYTKLDIEDVFNETFEPSVIEGKIVLMGYMGSGYEDYFWDEDKFFTPLNEKSVGRGYPDMFGVVVHANILSMMLEETYIDVMDETYSNVIAVVACYFNVAIFLSILQSERWGLWYNLLSKFIQLLQTIGIFTINFFAFAWYRQKIDLTLTTFAVLLSGDLAEIYVDVILTSVKKIFSSYFGKPEISMERKEDVQIYQYSAPALEASTEREKNVQN
ncbi:MAG: CHASE2 domain-containing protein [Cytophagales bacterium]|nr:CHASE2 domain-containing protein [Cytophagales bacterium]MDW8383930.1 CHASE2 domain-containing protein [Flammeovirgaceae bacterium]